MPKLFGAFTVIAIAHNACSYVLCQESGLSSGNTRGNSAAPRSRPRGGPHEPLVSYRFNQQLSGWESSSTDDSRLWGALTIPDSCTA